MSDHSLVSNPGNCLAISLEEKVKCLDLVNGSVSDLS